MCVAWSRKSRVAGPSAGAHFQHVGVAVGRLRGAHPDHRRVGREQPHEREARELVLSLAPLQFLQPLRVDVAAALPRLARLRALTGLTALPAGKPPRPPKSPPPRRPPKPPNPPPKPPVALMSHTSSPLSTSTRSWMGPPATPLNSLRRYLFGSSMQDLDVAFLRVGAGRALVDALRLERLHRPQLVVAADRLARLGEERRALRRICPRSVRILRAAAVGQRRRRGSRAARAATVERFMTSIIGGRVPGPWLSTRKEIVKNVKAYESSTYGRFVRATLRPREAAPSFGPHPAHRRTPGAAAGARRAAVSMGRPGERRRARADAAQPPQRGAAVPRSVRRRGRTRRPQPPGRPRHRPRRRLGAVHRSVRGMGGYVGAPSPRFQTSSSSTRRVAHLRHPEVRPGRRTLRARRVARGPRRAGGPSSSASCGTSTPAPRLTAAARFTDEESLIVSPLRNLIGPGGGRVRARPRLRRSSASPSCSSTCATCGSRSCRRWRGASSSTRTATAIAWRWCRSARPRACSTGPIPARPTTRRAPTPPNCSSAARRRPRGSSSVAGGGGGSAPRRRRGPPTSGVCRRRSRVRRATKSWGAGGCSCSTPAGRSRPPWPARAGATSASASACCCCSASASALLAAASRRAHRLAEQQMEFVAGVTHELRTPVAVIRSAAENLSHGVVGNADRVKRYGADDRIGGAPARRDDRERAAVRRARVGREAWQPRPRWRQSRSSTRPIDTAIAAAAAPARSPCSATSRPICRT